LTSNNPDENVLTSNNPYENPHLPMDFKHLGGKSKVSVFVKYLDCQKEIEVKVHRLDLGVEHLLKIYKLACVFAFFLLNLMVKQSTFDYHPMNLGLPPFYNTSFNVGT
jgi:hypothetical protein